MFNKIYVGLALLILFTNAQDSVKGDEEPNSKSSNEKTEDTAPKVEEDNVENEESGKSFSANIPYPPDQLGLENGYGYVPPQRPFQQIPGPYQQYPFYGGSAGYPNTQGGFYQGPSYNPYQPNYLQSYDWLYSRRSNTV